MTFSFIWDLWKKWNIRGFVILSLSLQVFLVLFAPIRKKITNNHIISLLWLAFLMADKVATFTVGLISQNQGKPSACAAEVDEALQAFWVSFLLLHIGGPDTIIAFSREDNSLWQRHLLSLIFQIGAVIYIFVQIFPNDNSLVIPTMLVFIAGVIKNAERILALNLSSIPRFKESLLSSFYTQDFNKELGVTYECRTESIDLVEELDDLRYHYSNIEEAKLPESIVVKHAYSFFQTFKIILLELIFTPQQHKMSRGYFYKVSAVDALRVISVELQFMYNVLHTKTLAICSKWSPIFRFIAFINIAMAFFLFNCLKKYCLPKLDVQITNSLLLGGMAIDVIAQFMLAFSDWTIAEIMLYIDEPSKRDSFLYKLVSAVDKLRGPRFATCNVETNANVTYKVLDTPLIFRRWSESISACNLLSEFLEESPRKMYKRNGCRGIIAFSNICSFLFRVAEEIISRSHQASEAIVRHCGLRHNLVITNTKHVSKNPFNKKLWVFIFEEVRRIWENADDPTNVRKILEARGNMFFERTLLCEDFLKYVTEVDYDESIIMWHIATEMWYDREKDTATNDEREFSKMLSDYMLYLLLNQSNVVSAAVGIAHIMSTDTMFVLRKGNHDDGMDMEMLCERLYAKPSSIPPQYSKTACCKGIELAQEMESLREMKWKMMSRVWVEILSYAAIHIKGEAHVQVLSKGGELLAFIWLLIAHLGCAYTSEVSLSFGC